MPQVSVVDATLYFREQGRGEPLLLLMGLGGNHRSWGQPFLDILAGNYRLIALDHRGTGRSTRGAAEYSLPQLAEDAAAVLAAIGVERAHVLGLSMGGMVAQELVLAHPQIVAGLILASTTCGGSRAIWRGPDSQEQLAEALAGGAGSIVVTPEFAAKNMVFLQRMALETAAAGIAPAVVREQLAAVVRFNTQARLGAVRTPTLIMAGDRDAVIPAQNARVLHSLIRGSEGAMVRDTGHLFVWEAPSRAASEIVRFLRARAPFSSAASRLVG